MTRTRSSKNSRGQGRTRDFPRLLGGRLCLDFANTVEAPASEAPVDFLHTYPDVVRWGWHAGLLQDPEAKQLLARREREPDTALAVYERAVALRRAIRDVFSRIAQSRVPSEQDLDSIWQEYVVAVANARLILTQGRYDWSWRESPDDLSRLLWPVARSAVDLLSGSDLNRVKECAGAGDCGWLFYDESRNGNRRWCSMEGCGSRVKMRAYYARGRGR